MLNQSEIIEMDGVKVVRKRYGELKGIVKWLIADFPFLQLLYPFETDPWKRMTREYTFFANPPKRVKTPRVLRYDPKALEIIREYIEGRDIEVSEADATLVGEKFAEMHNQNFCLGDTKPSNFKIQGNELYVIDAEQAINYCYENSYKAWDVIFHLMSINPSSLGGPLKEVESYADFLLNSYFDKLGEPPKYFTIQNVVSFLLLINPVLGSRVRRILVTRAE